MQHAQAFLVFLLLCLGFATEGRAVERDVRHQVDIDHGYTLPRVPPAVVPEKYLRRNVTYASQYEAGTIVIDPKNRFLYVIRSSNSATRYGVSVGLGAFGWAGEARIGKKAVWPEWTPPKEMIDRAPNLARYREGLAAGPLNPLGARALYLFQGSRDTLYRIHGTSEYWSIGKAASSGCIRILNRDVIDLYDQVSIGTKVVVLATGPKLQWRKRVGTKLR